LSLDHLVHLFAHTTQHYFPVVDDEQKMIAILSANDVRRFVEDTHLGQGVIAADLANPEVVVLTPNTDLETALKRFVSLDVDSMPVVDAEDRSRLLGMLSRRDLIRHYQSVREDFQKRGEA
jgi:CIC family chloride channel protein